jgi:threonyl-tRNA synthetase
MRILMIHANEFSFSVTQETSVAAAAHDLKDEDRQGKSGDSLVCFVSVEKKDEDNSANVVAEAHQRILSHFQQLKPDTLWIYPYAHLSSDLAAPRHAQRILDELYQSFAPNGIADLRKSPFGYYKAFQIQAKGHPLSEMAITATGQGVKAVDADAGESKAIAAEKKLKSRRYIVWPDGKEVEASEVDLSKQPLLKKLLAYETTGTRVSDEEPPHVKLMRSHELVDYEPGSDAGNFRWYPKGHLVKSLMEERVNNVMQRYGAMRVETPIMYDYLHPNLAKYLDRFPARQYVLKSEKKEYFLRFAACFGQYLIKHDMQISYRQLPVRLYELTHYSFRREQTGELAGLRRLRTFTMPDMHTLCRDVEQAKEEFGRQFDLSQEWMNDLGIPYVTAVRVVKSFYEEHRDFVHEIARKAGAPILLEVWEERFFYFVLKFEFNVLDNHDKASTLSTVQIDVENCGRFDIHYTDDKGEKATPLILHASISGSIDRNVYALLEHQSARMKKGEKGMYPFWLAPTQIRFIPVSDEHIPFCEELARDWPFRADVDDRSLSLGKKIRFAEQEWVPFIAVIGDKERDGGEFQVRVRGAEDFHGNKDALIAKMRQMAGQQPQRGLNTPRMLSARPIFVG